jgi:putative oxidoreductase
VTGPEGAYLIARILISAVWVAAAAYRAAHVRQTLLEMEGLGIPLARFLLPLVIALEIAGASCMLADYYVWAAAIVWLALLVPASYVYHVRFMIRDGAIDFTQYLAFWKNVSMAGGLIALILLDASRPAWLFTPA